MEQPDFACRNLDQQFFSISLPRPFSTDAAPPAGLKATLASLDNPTATLKAERAAEYLVSSAAALSFSATEHTRPFLRRSA